MIGEWLRNRLRHKVVREGRLELVQFLNHVENVSDRDIGPVVAVATMIRINLENMDVVPRNLFDEKWAAELDSRGRIVGRLRNLVRQFEWKKQHNDAVGTLVWLHTLRALTIPELRPLGCDLWRELRRGFSHVEEVLKIVEEAKNEPLDPRVREEYRWIPSGLGGGKED